ncbi:hypothetical protein HRE53_32155 (plasmid) [Acaryochloris sp. 'Moss Beach']|uniref:hypothetical protein n=1 Tax=Acaryochloris sp. 'Moss Beach' TaxID=2740837 RepID=UPI001F2DD872|nr:hypothetical protein [Acaryochloris sp. 'Moss Beach']UJB73218.1 hypothetical protein HRE53_32155 [Acaryochloris sp. 'Moss Beach']
MPTLLETPILRLRAEQQTQSDMWMAQTEADGIAFINEHTEDPLCPPYTLACIQVKDCGPFDADIDFSEHWVLMVTRKPTAEERTTQTRIENWVLNNPGLKGVLNDWYTVQPDQTVRAENDYEDEI